MRRLARRFRAMFWASSAEADLDDEFRHHLEEETRELIARGLAPDAARREAFRRFGGVDRHKEDVRHAHPRRLPTELIRDVRYAIRSLGRSPSFTIGILLVLALGIGAPTALFSVVNGVLLRPLPFPDPDRLVRVWPAQPTQGVEQDLISYPDFADWRDRTTTLSALGTYLPPFLPDWTLSRDGEPAEEVATAWVGGDFFSALGTPPELGRWMEHEDAEAGRPVVVLSHGAWTRLFGGDPDIVGRSVSLSFQRLEVIGVMPASFQFPEPDIEIWTPIQLGFQGPLSGTLRSRQVSTQYMVGRLADGATEETAREELTSIARALEEAYPNTNAGESAATVVGLRESITGSTRPALLSLSGAVAFFLLLAIANAANLLLARGTDRRREISVRKSLGASSARIARQLLTETLVLALSGGLLGTALGWLLVRSVHGLPASILPRATSIEYDLPVFLAGLGITVAVTSLAGLLPALRSARHVSHTDLRGSARSVGIDRRSVRQRNALVAGEVAIAVVLTVGAGLMVRSFIAISAVDTGLAPGGAVAMTLNVPAERYPSVGARREFAQGLLERIADLPGVTSAGATPHLPLRSVGEGRNVVVPGLFEPPPGGQREARSFAVSPEAFSALGMTMVEGRGFTIADGPNDPPVAVVNEAMIGDFFQGQNPLGRRFTGGGGLEWEVVGVVRDVRYLGPTTPPPPAFYYPLSQYPRLQQVSFVARSDRDPLALMGPMRGLVQRVDPDLPVSEIITLDRLTSEMRARPRLLTLVMSGFAGLAVALAILGVYSVLAYVVRGRAREIGIRSALGASTRSIVRGVVGSGMRPALVGLLIGLVAAGALTRFMRAILFEVDPVDPVTFVAAALFVSLAAAAACVLPARWAARVDPLANLTSE